MNKLILSSKKQFVENAIKDGRSKSEAEKYADKLIGLTFDVGHLNIHRKHGFSEEDLRKEFEAMSKHVKHVHLTDNFGSYDSHLPPGMGNVPFKKYFEELKKKVIREELSLKQEVLLNHLKDLLIQLLWKRLELLFIQVALVRIGINQLDYSKDTLQVMEKFFQEYIMKHLVQVFQIYLLNLEDKEAVAEQETG